jgi:putative Mn2+ efflux pump MntP
VLVIGVVTCVLSFAGVALGQRAGARFRGPAEVAGGLVLVAIGTRILLQHLGVV